MTSDADIDLRSAALAIIDELVGRYTLLEQRIVALEAAQQVNKAAIAFSERRSSWSVKQLAEDLGVHPNTVLNYIALPADHLRHLDTFQPGGTGPHMILPEHVAKWIARGTG